jgi:hypothetical protein
MNFTKPSLLAVAEAIGAKRRAVTSFVEEVLLQDTDLESHAPASTVALGLRVMTNALGTALEMAQLQARANGSSSSSVGDATSEKRELQGLVVLLFDCLKATGAQLGSYSTEDEQEKLSLYEAAADCALSLIRLDAFTNALTVDQWHTLGWTMLCPVASIRRRLFNTLSGLIQLYPLHAKFLAYPCLFATDEELQLRAEQALGVAVQRRRKTHEDLCSQLIGRSESQNKVQRHAESMMPEAVLPYLLHLLSYHPDFPATTAIDNDADKKRMKNLVRSVSMLLQVLQNSLRDESCNMSYLFKLLNTVNRYYIDRHDPDNVGLHFVTRMTVKLLNERIKTSDNLQNHPGEVTLPPELYQRRATAQDPDMAESSVAVMMLGAGTAEGFEEAELAIDKALQIAGKSNKMLKSAASKPAAVTGAAAGSRKRPAVASPSGRDEEAHSAAAKRRSSSVEKEKVTRLPEEAPTRVVPRRGAKQAAVSYKEAAESDKEMLQWEHAAAEARKPRRSSELSLPRSSTGSSGAARRSTSPAVERSRTSAIVEPEEPSPAKRARSQPSQPSQRAEPSFDALLNDDEPLVESAAPARVSDAKSKAAKAGPSNEAAANRTDSSKKRALQPKINAVLPPASADSADKSAAGAKRAKKMDTVAAADEEPEEANAQTVKAAKNQKSKAGVGEADEGQATGPVRRSARPVRA